MWKLTLCLTLAVLQPLHAVKDEVLLRSEYGVLFRKDRPLFNSNAYWRTTFAVPFESPTLPDPWKVDCRNFVLDNLKYPNQSKPPSDLYQMRDPALKVCRSFRTIVGESNMQIREFRSKINSTEESISLLLHPNMRIGVKNITDIITRYKRGAPLSFIGDLEKSIFGIATTEDVLTLANHIAHMETYLNKSSTARKSYKEHLDSFVQTTTDRLDLVHKQINANHYILNETLQDFNKLTDKIQAEGNIDRIWYSLDSLLFMVIN